MKKNLLKILVAVALFPAAFQACKFREEINTDPINPSDAPMSAILPVAQVGIAYTVGGNIARYNGMFTQQIAGVDRQSLSIGKGNIGQQDSDDPWDNMYKAMKNLKVIIEKADAQKSPKYKGVAQILLAYSLGVTTDMWGDVPYSEAFKGNPDGSGLRPKYDTQQQLYDTIQSLLDRGIANCLVKESTFAPGIDDVIYQGNLKKWQAFADALKARHYLHVADYLKAKEFAQKAIDEGFANAQVGFSGTSVTSQSPMFQFNDQRGDIGMASKVMDYFQSVADSNTGFSDPRLFVFSDFSNEDPVFYNDTNPQNPSEIEYNVFQPAGSFPGDGNFNINLVGSFAAAEGSPVNLMTDAELSFILAETKHRSQDHAGAKAHFEDGIKQSLLNSAAPIAESFPMDSVLSKITKNIRLDSLSMEAIITQKWLALFMQGEAWNDWRRTGFPVLESPLGNPLGTEIPRRYPYPQKERTLNSANVPDEGSQPALKRVWWDKK